jgi:hypothetical protein
MRNYGVIALRLLGVLIVTFLLAFRQAAPTLVLYYKFEETAGPNVTDSSGNNLTGVWSGTTTLISNSAAGDCAPTPAGNQRSIIFAEGPVNSTGGYILTTDTAGITKFTTPFSVMAWIKPTMFAAGQNPNNTGAILFDWVWTGSVFDGWGFDITTTQQLQFYTGNTTTMDTLQSTGTVPWGSWSHVAAVWDGSNKYIYINGKLDSTNASTLVPGQTTNNFQVGKDDYWRNFYGNVDEVRLYKGALTASQVLAIYNGVNAPTLNAPTALPNAVALSWNAVTGATGYNVYRGTTAGGEGTTPIATITSGTTTTYTDNGATYPYTYYYVVQTIEGTLVSAYSNEVSCAPLQVQILVTPTALTVAENGGTAVFTVSLVTPPKDPVSITITSSAAALVLSAPPGGATSGTVTLNWATNTTQPQTVQVTGVQQFLEGPPVLVPVNFTAVNGNGDPNYPSTILPGPVNCTIIEDTPAIIVNPSSISTTNGGPPVPLTVQLATQTTATSGNPVTLTLSVTDSTLATVTPMTLMFNNTNWNTPQPVTLNPIQVNTQTTYVAPYDIVFTPSGGDPLYNALGDTLVPVNVPVSKPPLAKTWGNCGLLGAEGLLPLAWALLWRRRRSRTRAR